MSWKDKFPKNNRYFETENGILYHGDCIEIMKKLPNESINLIVTSPPYNKRYWASNKNVNNSFSKNGKVYARNTHYGDYDDCREPGDYEKWQTDCLNEMRNLIVEDGSIFYNHIDILKNHLTIHPTFVYNQPLKQIIVWDRKSTPKLDKNYFLPVNEWIFWIKKEKDSKTKFNRKNADYMKNIWTISPKRNNGEHPAPMVIDIPLNCIKATTNENDIVFDPFMGSGTTAIASEKTNRKWVGIELSENYCKIIKKRIEQEQKSSATETLF
jgi:site-specific DNA-methyltransferase (adenine-specific)